MGESAVLHLRLITGAAISLVFIFPNFICFVDLMLVYIQRCGMQGPRS